MRVAVVGVRTLSLLSFRREMLRSMAANGHTVLTMAPEDDAEAQTALQAMGVAFKAVPFNRTSTNPLADIAMVVRLVRELRRFHADAVLVYGAKPVIYGSIAARLVGVRLRAAMITGAGSALAGGSGFRRRALVRLLRTLYRVGLRASQVVFFQNPDDEQLFRSLGLIGSRQRVVRINGSGVDLAEFPLTPMPPTPPVTFLLIGRLLRDKGVHEYVEAARRVRRARPEARFELLGPLDSNPSAIPAAEVDAWRVEGAVDYLGSTDDVRPYLAAAHVCVLPSYGEGMPRSVLEAMAMGRAILTTDAPGCRETVEAGGNGWLVAVRDADALAEGMLRLLDAPDRLDEMGRRSRALAEERFDVREVNRTILGAMGLA